MSATPEQVRFDRLAGALIGTAIGDALGLVREGLSPARARRLFGGPPLQYGLLFGRGFVSDDTEHTCMAAQALLASNGDPERFARSFAWRLRGWFACMPAGIGWATLRSCVKLWIGFSPSRSGVNSAGNGPAMRAGILGAALGNRAEAFVLASTRLTHRHPLADDGAVAVALAGTHAMRAEIDAAAFLLELAIQMRSEPFQQAAQQISAMLKEQLEVSEAATRLGLAGGVSGFILHTVPIALYAWLRHRTDLRQALESVILLGGDTDTVAAIVGGLVGASIGNSRIPADLKDRLAEWPRSIAWMQQLAHRLAFASSAHWEQARPLPLASWALPLRNALFAVVVIAHGLRRLLPPY